MNKFMQEAINEAYKGITNHEGGPFGAVIVKDNNIIGRGHNVVLKDNDPTCHGEIMAIHDACKTLESYDLSGCEIYTTGEPCQMCLCACLWANISKVYYGCTIHENSIAGFRDEQFNELLGGREKLQNYLVCIEKEACIKLFEDYSKLENKIY